MDKLKDASEAYYKKPLDKLNGRQKAELLTKAMNDKKLFNFNYEIQTGRKPKMFEDIYKNKSGDCEELSRFYSTVADKLGLKDISQFYVMFRNKKTGKSIGHTGIFYVEGIVFAIDPAFGKFEKLGEFSSPENALKSRKFRDYALGLINEVEPDANDYGIEQVGLLKGKENMDANYYFNNGVYYFQQENWEMTRESFGKALKKGIATHFVYSQIAQANYYLGNYKKAAYFYEKALQKKETADGYEDLGFSYSKLSNLNNNTHIKAVESFRKRLNLDPKNSKAILQLGIACNNAGVIELKKGNYTNSIYYFNEGEKSLTEVLKRNPSEEETIINHLLRELQEARKTAIKKLMNK